MKYLLFLIPLFFLSCNSVSDNSFSPEEVRKEAEQFMEAYAKDLLEYNREALGSRYDSRGTYGLGNGRKQFNDFETMKGMYADSSWVGPEEFSWEDLSYEVLGPDAVVTAGLFNWKYPNRSPWKMSYTSLLVKQNGVWKIRLENESVAAMDFVIFMLEAEESPLYKSLSERSLDPAVVKEALEALR